MIVWVCQFSTFKHILASLVSVADGYLFRGGQKGLDMIEILILYAPFGWVDGIGYIQLQGPSPILCLMVLNVSWTG